MIVIWKKNNRRDRSSRAATAPRRSGWITALTAAGILFIGATSVTLAQESEAPEGESHLGVYLNDSFEVRQELRVLDRLEASGNWTQASLKTQDLLAGNGDQAVEREPGLYTSVARSLSERVADWPAPGLAAFRELYESEAQSLLETARADRDLSGLSAILNRYFATAAGGEAVVLLARYRLEAGEFDAAASMLSRLLSSHPDYKSEPAQVLALYVAALHWSGRTERAQAVADRARAETPDARLSWAGVERPLQEILDELISEPVVELGRGGAPDLWAGFGGNSSRNLVLDSTAAVGAAIWSFSLTGAEEVLDTSADPAASEQTLTRGRYIDLFPSVRNNRVFLHDNDRAWALDLETGGVLWSYELNELSRGESGGDSGPPALHAPAIWKDRVFIALGSHDVPYYGSNAAASRAALLCIDARNGKQLWKVEGRELSPQFATIQFDGAPICADDKVVVVARRRKTFGFEDCLLFCFETRSGRLVWQTHLGSASAGGYGYRKPTISAPAVAGGTVYVQSNLGTIAAVDLQSGLLNWLRVYDSRNRSASGMSGQISAWEYNPTMIWRDRVIASPLDRDAVMVLDRETGAEVAEISNDELSSVQTLLGIRHDRLYFVGDQVGAWDLAENRLAWSEPLPDVGLFGRGALVANALFLPTTGYLLHYDLQGELIERAAWNPLEARGNIVATRDELLIASSGRLTCYAQKEDAIARLQARLEIALDDPRPCLDLAEMAFRTAEYELGVDALGQAVARTGGLFELQDAELKKRIFGDCLSFADRLLRDSPSYESQALALYKLAAECPPDAPSAVQYRLKMGSLYSRMRRPVDAIALYQQIIADRSLHDLPVPGAWQSPISRAAAGAPLIRGADERPTSGDTAVRLIDRILARNGREPYAPFEDQARELLGRGVRLEQPALLERVTELFPNAVAAPRARVALGDLWLAKGRFDLAARSYKMAKNLYGERIELPQLFEKIIRCYLGSGRKRIAADWLRNAGRRFPNHLVATDRGRITFGQWYEREISPLDFAGPTLPRVAPPLAQAHTRRFESTEVSILEPVFDSEPGTPRNVYLAHYKENLMLFDPVRDRPLWTEPAACKADPRLLAYVGAIEVGESDAGIRSTGSGRQPCMVLATQYQVFALDPQTGRQIWNYGHHPADADDPLADHENFTIFKNHALHGSTLVSLRASGPAIAHDVFSGRRLWSTDLDHTPGEGPADLNGEFFLYHAISGGEHVYPLIDSENGALLHTFEPGEDAGAPLQLFLLPEGIGLIVTTRSIRAYDLGSFTLLWRTDFEQNIVSESTQVGLDGLFLSYDRRHMVKRSLFEDRQLGRSAPLEPDGRPLDGLAARLHSETLFVTSDSSVTALDAGDLRFLWEGTHQDNDEMMQPILADEFLLGIGRRNEERRVYTAYFYNVADQSGRLAADGGVLELGEFEHLRGGGVHVRDDCVLVVDGNTILTWVAESAWPG